MRGGAVSLASDVADLEQEVERLKRQIEDLEADAEDRIAEHEESIRECNSEIRELHRRLAQRDELAIDAWSKLTAAGDRADLIDTLRHPRFRFRAGPLAAEVLEALE